MYAPTKHGSTTKAPQTWLPLTGTCIALPSMSSTVWQAADQQPAPTTITLPDETRPWDVWLRAEFPEYVTAPFAARHIRLWEWLEALTPGVRPRPKVEIWARGGAKSSSVE